MSKGENEAQTSTLTETQGYRATFREAVERARAAGAVDQAFVERIERKFGDLEEAIEATTNEDVLENLLGRAEELERLRAYVLPDHEILLQARTSIADMRDWGVPRATLRSIEANLVLAMDKKQDVLTKRAALHKLFDFYDFWEAEVISYKNWLIATAKSLSVILALALAGSVVGVVVGSGLVAFLAGGLAGSLASVLSRLPPMLGWGRKAAWPARMYSRIGLGLAGTLAGGGLMANGVITIVKDAAEFSTIISTSYLASTADGLYMVAVGILLGFSERLLSSLSGALVKSPAAQAASTREPVEKEKP